MTHKQYDVIIRGAGITGCTLGLILARQGIRTLVIDKTPHPRFALGESLLKPTVLWLRVLAERFGVEELAVLANLNRIHDVIAPTSGVKKSFGFVRHRAGSPRTVAHWWANIAVNYAEDVLEGHLFRQDIDAYLYARAAAAGCDMLIGAVTENIHANDDGRVYLQTPSGEVAGDYFVDCTGPSTTLSRLSVLEETPTRLRTNSRAIFTHMAGVLPFDECSAAPAPALPWHQGTLHHLLDGAWVWVIPFDNHPCSTNTLVSVGVNFDNHAHPANGQSPQQEWAGLLERYPALHAQFHRATPARPWMSAARVQHSTRAVVGERCCLLGQAAGSVDALYSRGLLNNFQGIYLLAEILIDAVRERSYDHVRFEPFERLQRNLLQIHDALVYGSYIAFRSIALTDWWLAMWSLTERHSLTYVAAPLAALECKDAGAWASAKAELMRGECVASQTLIMPALEDACAVMAQFSAGACEETATLRKLRGIEAPLLALGFNLESFRDLATRHVFDPPARRLLGTEHALTAAIEIIDRYAGLAVSLRVSTFVNAAIRLLALRSARAETIALVAPELAGALLGVIAKLAIPGSDPTLWHELVANLHSISLRVVASDASEQPATTRAGWRVLLECTAQARHVCLRIIRVGDAGGAEPQFDELELDTSAGGERLVVNITGHAPAALLADLASA